MCHIICLSISIHDLSFSIHNLSFPIRNIIGTHISVVNAAALDSDSANSNLKLGAISHINNPS
jgi:hypothetical protein